MGFLAASDSVQTDLSGSLQKNAHQLSRCFEETDLFFFFSATYNFVHDNLEILFPILRQGILLCVSLLVK
jgi:hypothetical protein